ncbi:geranylgeranylglycerol-phosphate geranylgeranyltransferase [Lutibacter aestuarii]|uniref:Geranylgeranylglycerol-phosphate geranylgeranyltransferase n=1 Tax=Lutibacter aestuarii TaxID=861111 RepID=A0ABW2Z7I6_9FLAO|nr:geranylgeranylglycerol-phosphate geranylgeranyltransferase [uncultured Lutibacter sp.]
MIKISAFLNLVRWKNLALIIYIQIVLKYVFFNAFKVPTQLNTVQFSVLIAAIVFITMAGYIINDIFDLKSDQINKPHKVIVDKHFSTIVAKKFYLFCNVLGIILGVAISLNVQQPSLTFIFLSTSLLLYFYSKNLKSKPLIGNLIVSFLIVLSILTLAIFDLKSLQITFPFTVILTLCLFAFFLNLAREIIKDIEDINGDYKLNMNTLPILLGSKRARYIAAFLCALPLGLLLFLVINFNESHLFTKSYLVVFVILPLLFVILKLLKVTSKKSLNNISAMLKIIMFLGISSLIIFSLNK